MKVPAQLRGICGAGCSNAAPALRCPHCLYHKGPLGAAIEGLRWLDERCRTDRHVMSKLMAVRFARFGHFVGSVSMGYRDRFDRFTRPELTAAEICHTCYFATPKGGASKEMS